MHKKGQGVIQGLGPLAVGLVAIGITLIVGFLIFGQIKTQLVNIEDTSGWCPARVHGTYGLVTTSGSAECCNSSACVFTNDAAGGGNYTYNASTGLCCNATEDRVDCNAGNTSAAYSASSCLTGNTTPSRASLAWNGTNTTQNAMQDIPGWLAIIVITIIGSLLIGLVAIFRSKNT